MCFSSDFFFFFLNFCFKTCLGFYICFFRGRLLCGVFYPHVPHLLGVQSQFVLAKMASVSATFVSASPRTAPTRGTKSTPAKCATHASVSSRAFSRGTSASFSGESVACARLQTSSRRGQRRVTTMAAKVQGYIKLAIEAGKANPAPPIGPALGAQVRFPRRLYLCNFVFSLFPSADEKTKNLKK